MTVEIPKGATFLGVPLIKVRNLLHAWRFGSCRDVAFLAKRKNVDLDPRLVMILLEELRDRELIGHGDVAGHKIDGLTERGLALAGATGQKSITKAAAWVILKQFLENCAEVNQSNWSPIRVNKVWLFGSLIDPEKTTVRDIDIVVEAESMGDYRSMEQVYRDAAERLDVKDNGIPEYFQRGRIEHRIIYGKQKHPRLAPNDMATLRDLACPCQLIFDRTRQSVDDPLLSNHPSATTRAAHISKKRVFPNLDIGKKSLRPLPVGLNQAEWEVLNLLGWLKTGPWPKNSGRYLPVLRYKGFHQVTTDEWLPRRDSIRLSPNHVTDYMDFKGCDGRAKFGMIGAATFVTDLKGNKITDRFSIPWREQIIYDVVMFALVVERSIQESASQVEYVINLIDGDISKFSDEDIDVCHAWLYYIATADLEHIRRRDVEAGVSREIVVTVGKYDPFKSGIPGALAKSLSKPYVISGMDPKYPSPVEVYPSSRRRAA